MVNQEMISPNNYYDLQKDKTYEELLIERFELIKSVEAFESSKNDENIEVSPSPDVRYQMELQYLAKLCELIAEKYNAKQSM